MKNTLSRFKILLTAGWLLLLALLALGSFDEADLSEAKPKVSQVVYTETTAPVNGSLDYGYNVYFSVINEGKTGIIRVKVLLSCSEGEWTREQSLQFSPGETRKLTYFFHEPSINAGNTEVRVYVTPRPKS